MREAMCSRPSNSGSMWCGTNFMTKQRNHYMVGLRCVAGSGIWGAVILRGCCVLEYEGFSAVLVDASWCCGLHGERGGGGGGFDAGGKMRGEGFDANETLLNDKQHVRVL